MSDEVGLEIREIEERRFHGHASRSTAASAL
jgi:hypothetical protein